MLSLVRPSNFAAGRCGPASVSFSIYSAVVVDLAVRTKKARTKIFENEYIIIGSLIVIQLGLIGFSVLIVLFDIFGISCKT